MQYNEEVKIEGVFYKAFILVPVILTLISLIVWFAVIPAVAGVNSFEFEMCCIIVPAIVIVSWGIFFACNGCRIVVTDKRVYGKALWGKRVDLPLDSISSISAQSLGSKISVSTSSGNISFVLLKNLDDVYEMVNSLLITRQTK